jgi:hypothetical protein
VEITVSQIIIEIQNLKVMSAFNLSGVVKECWRYHKIYVNDANEDNGPWGDLCSIVFKMTVIFDQMPTKDVKVFFYDYWATRYRFSVPGDRITISGSAELVRRNVAPKEEREHKCCIALREDEVDEEPLLIEVSIQSLADVERKNAIEIVIALIIHPECGEWVSEDLMQKKSGNFQSKSLLFSWERTSCTVEIPRFSI